MRQQFTFVALIMLFLGSQSLFAQEIQTLFKKSGIRKSGGYASIGNQFTTINGDFANMPSIYGGWFINRKFLVGLGMAATTNHIPVPLQYSENPLRKMTYQYGQFGLMTEYVAASSRLIHLNFNLLTGAGFALQYDRQNINEWDFGNDKEDTCADFFFVMEPGIQVEFNLLKWMRFSPGVSYRRAFGSNVAGLSDRTLSNVSYNVSLKFGKF